MAGLIVASGHADEGVARVDLVVDGKVATLTTAEAETLIRALRRSIARADAFAAIYTQDAARALMQTPAVGRA